MSPLSFGLGKNLSSGGGIVTNGLVLSLDAGVSSSYPGTGTTWTDLSGNGNNGTLVGGVGYNGNRSSLVDLDVQGFLGATVPSGTGLDIPLETVSGTGSGATASYLASGNQITFIQILSGGNGYTQGSVLRLPVGSNPTIVLGNLPGGTPVLFLTFDGSNDYVIGNTPSGLDLSQPCTINVWVYFNNFSEINPRIIEVRDGSNSIQILRDGSTTRLTTKNSNFQTDLASTTWFVPSTGTWYNITAVWTPSTSTTTLYLNGALQSSVGSTSVGIGNQANKYVLGNRSDFVGTTQLAGNIAQVSIYNRALSAAEITQNFNALRRRYGI